MIVIHCDLCDETFADMDIDTKGLTVKDEALERGSAATDAGWWIAHFPRVDYCPACRDAVDQLRGDPLPYGRGREVTR